MSFRGQLATVSLVILLTVAAYGQVFRVQGGQSTLLNAQGGTVEFKAPNYNGSLGLGFYNGHLEMGAETHYLLRGYTILAGDESIPFLLPTDIFDGSHYFVARGAGVTRGDERGRYYAFVGATSTLLGAGFFNAASIDSPAATFFFERKLSPELKFFSREIVSTRQTALQGVEWKANPWLKAAMAAGIGGNQGYWASSVEAETQKLALKSSYVLTADTFRRVTVDSPLSSEVNKGNIELLYKPWSFVSFTTAHENILEPVTINGPTQQASVNQFSTDFHVARFYFGSGIFMSDAAGRKAQGTNLYMGRRITRRFETAVNWFESQPNNGQKTTILSGTLRENFSERFSLLQLISRTEGQTTFAFGGDFTSNRLLLHANYQNVYLPFRPERPFQQALAVNASLRLIGPLQLTVASDVAPDGHIRYSFGASTYLYRVRGMSFTPQSADSFSIAKYVVQGVVLDDHGAPVEGAALRIGREIVYSDSSGHFQARLSRRSFFPVEVVPEEFLTNQRYELVAAPPTAKAEVDTAATDIRVVVRAVLAHPRQTSPAK